MTESYEEEVTWLVAHLRNIASRHGRDPTDVADDVINEVYDV